MRPPCPTKPLSPGLGVPQTHDLRFEAPVCLAPSYPAPGTLPPSVSGSKIRAHGFERYPINFCQVRVPRTTILRSVLPIIMGTPLSWPRDWHPQSKIRTYRINGDIVIPLLEVTKPSNWDFLNPAPQASRWRISDPDPPTTLNSVLGLGLRFECSDASKMPYTNLGPPILRTPPDRDPYS